MKKKDIDSAVNDYLGGKQQKTLNRAKSDARNRSRASLSAVIDKNTAGYEVATFSVNTEAYDKIKEIAYIENLTIKKVMEQAMNAAIRMYEANHGEIKPRKIKQGIADALFV